MDEGLSPELIPRPFGSSWYVACRQLVQLDREATESWLHAAAGAYNSQKLGSGSLTGEDMVASVCQHYPVADIIMVFRRRLVEGITVDGTKS